MNSLAHKSALVLLYSKSTEIDFGPYNLFASIIQSLFREYNVKRRSAVCIQRIYRGFARREVLFWPLALMVPAVGQGLSLLKFLGGESFFFKRMESHHASIYHTRNRNRFI